MRDDVDLSSHHIEGYASAAEERGIDAYFSMPLISHIDGNLWVGGCRNGVWIPEDFRYILSLFSGEKYVIPDGCSRVIAEMRDAPRIPDQELLYGLADLASRMLSAGKTLIHCQAGLNRANLVAALMLIRHRSYKPYEAISLLREKRSSVVLCNETFETWLHAQIPGKVTT